MKHLTTLCICIALWPGVALSATLLDTAGSGGFKTIDDQATAVWTRPQETELASAGRILTVEVIYTYLDNQLFQDFKFTLRFSGTANPGAVTPHTSGQIGHSDRLQQKLDTGGDRYFKSFDLTLLAESRDKGNDELLDSESDTMTFTVFDTTWKIPTQTNITSPISSVYKFDDIIVNGTVKRQPEDGSGGWPKMDDDRIVDIQLTNGPGIEMSASVQTSDGNFNHTFAAPLKGWDDRFDYTVTATFRAGQVDPADPYALEYESSSDSEQHAIDSKRKQGRSWGQSFIDETLSTTVQNPSEDDLPDGSTLTFDPSGLQVGSGGLVAPPPNGTSIVDEDTLDDDLSGSSGTIEIAGAIPGSEIRAQPGVRATSGSPLFSRPGPSAWVPTPAYPLPAGWSRRLAFLYVPASASPAQLNLRFYDAAGALLRTENTMLGPHARFEVPEVWLAGAASAHADIAEGLLAGWDDAAIGTTDAFGTLAQTSPGTDLSAPFLAADGGWSALMILHNPADSPTTVDVQWYSLTGTPLSTLTPTIGPKQTITYDANVVAPGLDKSADVVAVSGDGVVGACVRLTNNSATMAEPLLDAASQRRISSPATTVIDQGVLVLRNPDDQPITVDVQDYRLDGSSLGGSLYVLGPRATELIPLSPSGVGEPIPSMEIRTVGGGKVAAMAMFGQISNGGVCSVPALPMPDIVRCQPPDLQNGWNLASIPLDPDEPGVDRVLAALEQAGNVLIDAVLTYDGTDYRAYPAGLSDVGMGDGFWLNLSNATSLSAIGTAAGEDVRLALHNGWTLIGHPMTTSRALADCSITDGVDTKSVAQAGLDGWIQSTLYGYAPGAGYQLIKPDGTGDDDQLRPCHGYWVRSYGYGLTFVVPLDPGGGSPGPAVSEMIPSPSRVTLHLETGVSLPWDFRADIDASASEGVDPLDLAAPPTGPPGLIEVRFNSLRSPEGSFTVDSRPGVCGRPVIWSALAEAHNFAPGQCEQATLTWDLSAAGSYAYQLVDIGAGQVVNLTPGDQYIFQICDQQPVDFELRAEIPGIEVGDFDCDGDADGNDFLTFANCFNGSLKRPNPGCANPKVDVDQDGDVDGVDFLTFANCFNGSLNPPACP